MRVRTQTEVVIHDIEGKLRDVLILGILWRIGIRYHTVGLHMQVPPVTRNKWYSHHDRWRCDASGAGSNLVNLATKQRDGQPIVICYNLGEFIICGETSDPCCMITTYLVGIPYIEKP